MVLSIILLCMSVVFALFIAEIILRILGIGYGNVPQEAHPVFHHVHPREYRFLSHIPSGEYGGHEVYYNKNRLIANPKIGYRENKNTACKVIFLGDSFTEAVQVAYRNSFVGMLDQSSNCVIKNYGVSSYSPIFYLLQWRKIIKELRPTLVIVQLYSNDIVSDKNYMQIANKNRDGDVTEISGPKKNWMIIQLRKSYLVRFLRKVQLQLVWSYENSSKKKNVVAGMVEENPGISKLSSELVRALSREVQASGVEFILTVIPSKFRLTEKNIDNKTPQFSSKWKAFSLENNINFLDLTAAFKKESKKGFQLFFKRDIHFNENGHIIVASELSKTYPKIFNFIDIRLSN